MIKADGINPTRIVTFKYDALGRRYSKEYVDFFDASKSYSRKYVFDGRNIIAEVDAATNAVVATYLHGPGVNDVISMLRDRNHDQVLSIEEMFLFGRNALGSITEVTSRTGILKQRLRYSSYGDTKLGKTDTDRLDEREFIETLFGFTGVVVVPEVGLLCMDYRCYDPNAGRFLSEEPSGRDGPNLYWYAFSSPQKFIDPNGLASLNTNMTAGTTEFDPTPEEFGPPYLIETRNVVTSTAKPGANDEFETEDVYQSFRMDDIRYGPRGAYIETGDSRGRDIHGGGSRLDRPYDPRQGWAPTLGCTRGQNEDVIRLGNEISRFRRMHPGVKIPYKRWRE